MDWMDQYLDSLSDGRNAVYPPDSHTWRPVKPTKQQQSLIQDAMVSDLVRMRLIQEARQAEIDAGMGGGYDAGSAAKEGPVTPDTPTPSPTPTSTATPTPTPTPEPTATPTITPTPTSTVAPAFPSSITLTGTFGGNSAPNELFPITSLDEINISPDSEIPFLADTTVPYRIYLSTNPNGSNGHDYKYLIYLANNTGGYYSPNITLGRWFIANGSSYSGDNDGYYTNFGYYSNLQQSKTTVPSDNIANWTRVNGYYPDTGSITAITFNY